MEERSSNATIIYRKDLTDDLTILRVKPDSGVIPEFEAGQYGELALPELYTEEQKQGKFLRRPYSIASAPKERDYLEFFVVRVPDGDFTPLLFSREEGSRLWLGPKIKGKFTLAPVPADKDIITVCTGTGLAPFLSMYRELRGTDRWRRFVIIQGARYAQDLGYQDELIAYTKEDPNFFYLSAVTREPENGPYTGLRGRVNIFLEPDVFSTHFPFSLNTDKSQILLCGNPDMIDTVIAQLQPHGFREHSKKNPGNIHFERFW